MLCGGLPPPINQSRSIASALVHRGTISIEELRTKLADIETRPDGPKAGKP